MHKKAYLIVSGALILTGCHDLATNNKPQNSQQTTHTLGPSVCPLPVGKHSVKSVSFQSGSYELFVFNVPICVKQPVRFEKIMLAELEGQSGSPNAQIDVMKDQDPVLHVTRDFKIEVISLAQTQEGGPSSTQTQEGGAPPQQVRSSWMPFLAGAAGAAVAGMAVNALFKQPKYYLPPPNRPGVADVRGYGASSSSYTGVKSDYQTRWNQPAPVPQKSSFFRKKENTASLNSKPSLPSAYSKQGVQPPPRVERERYSFQKAQPSRARPFFRRRSR